MIFFTKNSDSQPRLLVSPRTTAVFGVSIWVFFLAGGGVAAASDVAAEPGELISIGDTIVEALDRDDRQLASGQFFDSYTVDAVAGSELFIALSSSEFDSFLWLLDSSGDVVSIDDDSGSRLGSVISSYLVPETDTYTLWVSSYSAEETGRYRLWLNEIPFVGVSTPIALGEQFSGWLTGGDLQLDTGHFYDVFSFDASPGRALSIRLRSRDAHLWLLNDEATVLAASDPLDESRSESVINFVPQIAANYTILASASEPRASARYLLELATDPVPTEAKEISDVIFDRLSGDRTASGIDPGPGDFQLATGQYLDIYKFDGEAGQNVALDLASVDFDGLLMVLDSEARIIASDDDSGVAFDASIRALELPVTGTYYVWVRSVFPGEEGAYALQFELASEPFANDPGLARSKSRSAPGSVSPTEHRLSLALEAKRPQARFQEFQAKGGNPFVGADRCVSSTTSFTAKVLICVGDPFAGTVEVSGPAGIVISPSSASFSVAADSCTTISPFSITSAGAGPGAKTITATVSGLGSDSEVMNVVAVPFAAPRVIRNGQAVPAVARVVPPAVSVDFDASNSNLMVSPSSGEGMVGLVLTGVSNSSSTDDTLLRASLPSGEVCSVAPVTVYDFALSDAIGLSGEDNLVPRNDVLPVPSAGDVTTPLVEADSQFDSIEIFYLNFINAQINLLIGGADPADIEANFPGARSSALALLDVAALDLTLDVPALIETVPASAATFQGTETLDFIPADLPGEATFELESAVASAGSVTEPPPWVVAAGTTASSSPGSLNPGSTALDAPVDLDAGQGRVEAFRIRTVITAFFAAGENELFAIEPLELVRQKITVIVATKTKEEQLADNAAREIALTLAIDSEHNACILRTAATNASLLTGCAVLGFFNPILGTLCAIEVGVITAAMVVQCNLAKAEAEAEVALWKLLADIEACALWTEAKRQLEIAAALALLDALIPC